MNSLKEIEKEIELCSDCPFDDKKDVRYCGGTGTDHRVMFIAESPSTSGTDKSDENRIKPANENFKRTDADKLFFEIRKEFGFDKCYLTDVVKCGKARGKPTNENIKNCIPYLLREIELVKPKVIVAVGKSFSTQEIPEKRKSSEFDKFIKDNLKLTVPVKSTYHYSYIWRWKRIKNYDKNGALLDQIQPEWRKKYEEEHREIQKCLQKSARKFKVPLLATFQIKMKAFISKLRKSA